MLAHLTQILEWLRSEDRGASMVEYALLVVLIAIIAIVAISFAGDQVSSVFSNIGNSLAEAGG